MSSPPSPLGVELRWMRRHAGLSGPALASRLGISQPYLSQVETGKRQAGVELVERWYAECVRVAEERLADEGLTVRDHRELAAAVDRMASNDYRLSVERLAEDANTEIVSNYVITRTGLAQRQQEIANLDRQAIRILHFQPLFCPGPLQTDEYARLVFAGHAKTEAMRHMTAQERANALDAASAARVQRAGRLMESGDPSYSVILTEQSLCTPLAGSNPELMARLVKHVATLSASGEADIRIIPFGAPFEYVPLGAFVLYELTDGRSLVLVETHAAGVSFTAPRDVRQHLEAWDKLTGVALSQDESTKWLHERSKST